jgi:phosphatidylglycerophosphatase A
MTKTRLAFVLATWFGIGFSPLAPGTLGTLAALPLYFALRGFGSSVVLAAAIVLGLAGVWASGVVAAHVGKEDPQIVVIDEVAGVLVALAFAPPTVAGFVLAVVLFRVFDMTKPFPARAAERLPGGWGIVVDDIAAGLWSAAITRLIA